VDKKTEKEKFIYWNKKVKKHQVLIRAFKKSWHIGYFESLSEAISERDEALRILPPAAFESKRETKWNKFKEEFFDVENTEEEESKTKNDVDDVLKGRDDEV